ncbi:MAG: hypothetical protein E7399_01965 [Ruminococcaceae bacterium]|nr:hypothetical protein [Oscillospiraceae bacterium]
MKKVPISIIIDDPAPIISVFHSHHKTGFTKDGRPILEYVSNDFLKTFCDIVEKHGIKGKFSVVPMPGNKGDILNGLEGADQTQVNEWLDMVKTRLVPHFSIGPEMLTHNKAVDLKTGDALPLREDEWASSQDKTTLTPYIAHAVSILQKAGFDVSGLTSPWQMGIDVEEEYTAAISKAIFDVTNKKNAWFFLRGLWETPNAKPWVELEEDGRCLVSIPATTYDRIWQSIDTTRTDDAFISQVADILITKDGTSGEILQVLETGGYPILITHWQSLVSNGLGTGLQILDEIGKRINQHLSHRVEWMSAEEIMNLIIQNKTDYPKPKF